jgi:hypothetical protein
MNRTAHICIAQLVVTQLVATLLVATLLAGCNIETTPSDESDAGSEEKSSRVDLNDGFHLEPYGIGADWYDYDSTTHAITPRSLVYRVSGGELDVYFTIESYYDERGDSGYFTLAVRPGADDAQTTELALGANAKDAPVCVDMIDLSEVDCSQDAHHLVFRADLRVVPAAGFAVQNPSVYTNSHFTSDQPLVTYQAPGDSLDSLPDEWTRLPDAKTNKEDQLLYGTLSGLTTGDTSDIFVQATADMMLAAWSISAENDDHTRLSVQANCQALEVSSDLQASPDISAAEERSVEVDAALTYIDLCGEDGPEVVGGSSGYDLIVETFAGEVSLRLPPGHLIWSTQTSEIDGAVDVPSSLWE